MSSDQGSLVRVVRSRHLLLPLVRSASAPPRSGGRHRLATAGSTGARDEFRAWTAAVAAAVDPCLVLDARGRLAAVSAATATLLGCAVAEALGRRLVPEVLSLIDFTAAARPAEDYADRIPPVLALRSGAPARGLMRIRREDGSRLTLDGVAAPLRDPSGAIGGSVCFLTPVPAP